MQGIQDTPVYQRKSDGKWVASITLDDGRRKVFYADKQADALKKLKVDVPHKTPFEIHPLSVEQMQKLIAAARGHTNEALFILAIATGMRRGEIAGLKWQDVNIEQGTLQVKRALTRVPTSMGSGYQEAEPKTEKSRRSIALPDFAIVALIKHRERQEVTKQKAGEYWQEHDYVFCTSVGEHIHPGHHILEEFKKLLKKQVYQMSVFMICGTVRRRCF